MVSVNGNVVTVTDLSTGAKSNISLTTVEQAQLYAEAMNGGLSQRDVTFAISICMARKPSSSQMYWVGELLKRAEVRRTPVTPTSNATIFDVKQVMEMFTFARKALKRPKVTLVLSELPTRQMVRISLKGDQLWLNSETFGNTYGRINTTTGELIFKAFGLAHKAKLIDLLTEFCASPREVAIRHGKLTGNCCYCQLPLSDERSLHEGYGKRCARHWGMPWGNRPGMSPVGNWILNVTETI